MLITGASGFVGRELVSRLLSESFRVRAAFRSADEQPAAGAERLDNFDLISRQHFAAAVADVDSIIHLAARVHVRGPIDDHERRRYDAINVDGTIGLAEAAANAGVRRFIFMSTIAVNGSFTDMGHPFTDQSPRLPRQPYAYSKSAAEKGLEALARQTGIEVVIIRPPLVYGPGVKGNFRTMMKWVARGIPLPFGAVTENRRTLIGLDNLVELIRICIDHPAAANQIFLAGDEEDLSTADLLQRLARAMGIKPRLISVPPRPLELAMSAIGLRGKASRLFHSLQVDSSKARALLGWKPIVSVDEGLERAVTPRQDSGDIG